MILVDFSSIIHRMVFSSSKEVQPKEIEGKYITSEYSSLMLYYIMNELINIQLKHQAEYGEMVLLFDDWRKDYWRKDVYPAYKASRTALRAKTKINYSEVYVEVNKLVEQLEVNTPWRCVSVNRAEADDTILILAREYNPHEKILIYSPDKDFIQAQRFNENVSQYSALTRKWLVPEGKHDSMDHWTLEHVCLGDDSDGVPKIVAHTEFSENFINHLKDYDIDRLSPHEFKTPKEVLEHHTEEEAEEIHTDNMHFFELQTKALETFEIQKKNRAGIEIGLDVYKDMRFGAAGLKKAIATHGSLDGFLDSHPLYRAHYDRNYTLVMEEGIPQEIRDETLLQFNQAAKKYNQKELVEYLHENNLFNIETLLIKVFKPEENISVENCGW